MKSPCVRIWKFSDAPKELQLLHKGARTPEWVALVPRDVGGKDLDDVMARPGRPYEMPNGDVAYIGMFHTRHVSEVLAAVARPKSARLSSR